MNSCKRLKNFSSVHEPEVKRLLDTSSIRAGGEFIMGEPEVKRLLDTTSSIDPVNLSDFERPN